MSEARRKGISFNRLGQNGAIVDPGAMVNIPRDSPAGLWKHEAAPAERWRRAKASSAMNMHRPRTPPDEA
jgi:hypothetical protein